MKKRLFAMILAVVMVLGTLPVLTLASFADDFGLYVDGYEEVTYNPATLAMTDVTLLFTYGCNEQTAMSENPENYIWVVSVDGVNYTAQPSSFYDNWLVRFRPTHWSTPYVPAWGSTVSFGLTVYASDGVTKVFDPGTTVSITFPEQPSHIASVPATAIAGSNVTWAYDGTTAVLTFAGTGAIPSYEDSADRPWQSIKDHVEKVVVSSGVTEVGKNNCSGFENLEEVELSESVVSLDGDCFAYCGEISYFKLSSNITNIGQGAVYGTDVLTVSCTKDWRAIEQQATVGYYNDAFASATWVDVEIYGSYLSFGKFGSGMENWTDGSDPELTQILINTPTWDDVYTPALCDVEWTLTLEADGISPVTMSLYPRSVYDGETWCILRFVPALSSDPAGRFVPVPGVEYTLTATVTYDGRTDSCTCHETFSLDANETPITFDNYYEITWQFDGVTEYVENIPEGFAPEYHGAAHDYVDGSNLYTVTVTPTPVAATANATYNVTYTVSDVDAGTLGLYGDGYENWGEDGQTQFLLCPLDKNGNELTDIADDTDAYTWILTINGVEYNVKPSSHYESMIFRFEPCLWDTPLVPHAGTTYTVGMRIYNGANELVYSSRNTVSIVIAGDFVPVHEHTYTGEVTTAPTCVDKGVKTYTCSECGATYTEDVEPLAVPTISDVTDTLTRDTTGVSNGSTNYTAWTYESTNGIAYAGQSAGGNNAIQIRTTNSNSGVVLTANANGWRIKSISVTFINNNGNNNRKVDVYAKTSAYESAADLFGDDQGTLVTTFSYNRTALTATYNFAADSAYTYIGLRSENGALYIGSIEITYEKKEYSHTLDAGVVTTAPTCTTAGEKTYTCSVCGMTVTEELPALASPYVYLTDTLTVTDTGATSTSYVNWNSVTKNSGAVYAGNSAKDNNGAIQIRSRNSNSGIIVTANAGGYKVVSVKITFSTGNPNNGTVDIYGKNTAYSAVSDLYGNATQQGTKLGSIVYGTSTELTITGDYAYIGLRSNNGSLYLTSIEITYVKEVTPAHNYENGVCTVCGEHLKGDVNGSNDVTIADVTAILNYLRGDATAVANGYADVNNDGVCNVSDLTEILDILADDN